MMMIKEIGTASIFHKQRKHRALYNGTSNTHTRMHTHARTHTHMHMRARTHTHTHISHLWMTETVVTKTERLETVFEKVASKCGFE